MVDFPVKDCTDCNSLEEAICAVNGALAAYGRNGWQNVAYMTRRALPHDRIKRLLYYQIILENLKWNQCFYTGYDFVKIVSAAQEAAAGIAPIPKRTPFGTAITTTTTTTSTTSTTTTSTTSTTTSTTSTTTSTTTSSTTSTTTTTTTTP